MAEAAKSRRRTATAALLCALALLLLVVHFRTENEPSSDPSGEDDGAPHFQEYAYVIVTYHKMGHELSHVLRGYVEQHAKMFGARLRRNGASPRASFNEATGCSDLSFGPGTVTIVEAPEFHCAPEQLAELLLRNPDPTRPKRGVKMVHLVRDPFAMAVSNYHYHSQDPTPEPYVHWKDPCLLSNKRTGPLADLVAPLLSDPASDLPGVRRELSTEVNGGLPPRTPIMTHDDFGGIIDDCRSLYQTGPGLGNATYYEHLRALPPGEGLRMATADKFGHIALMASDLLMFHRVQRMEQERSSRLPNKHRQLELITMPMQDWIDRPGESMRGFLDFVFGDHMRDRKKDNLSARYEKGFAKYRRESSHITTGKHEDTAELTEYLRGDPVFGGPLARIEALLDGVLRLQSMQQ